MKIQQILISIMLVIILIIWYYLKKNNNTLEHFNIDLNFICTSSENEGGNMLPTSSTITTTDESNISNCTWEELGGENLLKHVGTKFSEKEYYFYDMKEHSMEIKHNDISDIKNIGLYFNIKKSFNGNIMTLTTTTSNTENIYVLNFNINVSGELNISGNKDDSEDESFNKKIPIETVDDVDEYKFWLNIKLKDKDKDPFIEINLNNAIKIDIKKEDIFTDDNTNTELFIQLRNWNIDSFDGKVVEINGWNDNFKEHICNHYYCEKNDPSNNCDFTTKKDNDDIFKNKEDCINECDSKNACNIIECQKRCLECRGENGQQFEKVDRDTYCPWIKKLIAPPQAPEAPKIRGFPDEKNTSAGNTPIIVLEWRKPNSSSCKIGTYIIEIKELGIGSNSIKILNVPQLDKDNFQKEIINIKPKTTYKISIVALGKINIKTNNEDEILNLISKKSNVLTITTTGENNNILKQTYNYFDNDNENLVSYVCDYKGKNSDHILNNINNDEIDIYKSLKNL